MSVRILIDDPQERCSVGRPIFGRVICELAVPNFIEVKVKLFGEECTHCGLSPGALTANRELRKKILETKCITIYRGYLSFGNSNEFRFTLTLPRHIPSSYVGNYGHVKFFLRAYMVVRWHELYEHELELKVFSPIDLNVVAKEAASEMEPIIESDKIVFGEGLWCFSEVIKMGVKLKNRVFSVRETVPVEVTLSNTANVRITSVTAKIVMGIKTILRGRGESKEIANTHEVLASLEDNGAQLEREKMLHFYFNMGNNAELCNFDRCTLFTQTTALEVIATLQGYRYLVVEVELILGHIPVNRNYTVNFIDTRLLPEFAVIRKIETEGSLLPGPYPLEMSMPSLSCTSPRRDYPPYHRLPRSFTGEASAQSSLGLTYLPPLPSYSHPLGDHRGFKMSPSAGVHTGRREPPSISRSQPNVGASVPYGRQRGYPDSVEVSSASLPSVAEREEPSHRHVSAFPTAPREELDLPPTYEEAMYLIRKGTIS